MRLVSIYWVLAADRVNQAVVSGPSDAQFVAQLANEIEVARMENAFIWVEVNDWDRLLRLVPTELRTARAPPNYDHMKAKMKELELKRPMIMRGSGPTEDVTEKLRLVDAVQDGAGEVETPTPVKPVMH
jgi:hypothetical protein